MKNLKDSLTRPAPNMIPFLFVYGTLLKGLDALKEWNSVIKPNFIGQGKLNGLLYDLGEYPGAIIDTKSRKEFVSGEVYELKNPTASFKILDEYEEFFPSHPQKSLFIRRECPVTLENGKMITAWVYVYNQKVDKAIQIKNGKYLRRHQQ